MQQKQDEYIKQFASKADLLTTHNMMLESQITQQASSCSAPVGRGRATKVQGVSIDTPTF